INGDPLAPLFGGSISMANPDVISIGAIGSPASNSGRVGVYYWNGSKWLIDDKYIVGYNLSDCFGTSVSMGDYYTVGIGANFNNLNTGQVKIYEVCVPTTTIESITACDSIDWIDGNTYLTSGTYSYTATSVLGCDSLVLLNLTINNGSSSIQNETSLNSYFWTINGQTYTQSGSYTGVIPSVNGCDSVITLNLTLNFTGLNQEEHTDFTLFPNPATDKIAINTDEPLIGSTFQVYDQVGRLVFKGNITNSNTILALTGFSKGMYTLHIEGQGRRSFMVQKD
ncbi:MAG: T9SS type A sorting domain-containing protein, partial [bacterium]